MKRLHKKLFILSILLVLSLSFSLNASVEKRIYNCIKILNVIMTGPESDAPRYLLSHSRAVILIPGIKKIGFIAGVKRGKGVIVFRDRNGKWLPPLFISIHGGSFGFQIGAKSSDVVLLLMNDKAVDKFKHAKIKLGADIGVAAGPVGKEIGLSNEDIFRVDAFSYVREKGLFAGAILSGSIISYDEDSTKKYYGKIIKVEDLFSGNYPKNLPKGAENLLLTLKKLSKLESQK